MFMTFVDIGSYPSLRFGWYLSWVQKWWEIKLKVWLEQGGLCLQEGTAGRSEMRRDFFPVHFTNQILLQAGTDKVAVLSHARQVFTLTLSSSGQLVHRFRLCWQKNVKHYFNAGWRFLFPHILLRMEFYNFAIHFKTSWSKCPVNLHISWLIFKYSPHRNLKAMQIFKEKRMILLPIR